MTRVTTVHFNQTNQLHNLKLADFLEISSLQLDEISKKNQFITEITRVCLPYDACIS